MIQLEISNFKDKHILSLEFQTSRDKDFNNIAGLFIEFPLSKDSQINSFTSLESFWDYVDQIFSPYKDFKKYLTRSPVSISFQKYQKIITLLKKNKIYDAKKLLDDKDKPAFKFLQQLVKKPIGSLTLTISSNPKFCQNEYLFTFDHFLLNTIVGTKTHSDNIDEMINSSVLYMESFVLNDIYYKISDYILSEMKQTINTSK